MTGRSSRGCEGKKKRKRKTSRHRSERVRWVVECNNLRTEPVPRFRDSFEKNEMIFCINEKKKIVSDRSGIFDGRRFRGFEEEWKKSPRLFEMLEKKFRSSVEGNFRREPFRGFREGLEKITS